jgi:hypothetical protein
MVRQPWFGFFSVIGVIGLCVAMLLQGCKIQEADSPTSPTANIDPNATTTAPPLPSPSTSVTVTTPQIISPPTGTDVDTAPSLVVTNATVSDGSIPTYSYRVATDADLSNIIASVDRVPQGAGGQTSWQIPRELDTGRYYWKAQATTGQAYSTPSSLATFTVGGGGGGPSPPSPSPSPGGILISDSLLNGTSQGFVNGGRFTRYGWQMTSQHDFIRYEVPAIRNGFVEWTNVNLYPRNTSADTYILFGMWDPTRGDYRENPFRVHIQKLDDNHNRPYVRLRWIANGEQHDKGYNFMEWDPGSSYEWRIDWGPDAGRNAARVYLNGQLIIEVRYTNTYEPQTHWIELGVAERHESCVGAVFSNFRVGSR